MNTVADNAHSSNYGPEMSVKKSEPTDLKPGAETRKPKKKKKKQAEGTRETVESIAIAFILAFLFKTFQAEAYVIPTGSMAPTLYGRHKEISCDGCGFEFALGASSEIDQNTSNLQYRIKDVFCSNCGKHLDAGDAPVFNGDRILVNKQVSEYKRFDVVVFKNPEQAHVNYIKRLVGLPGETIRIRKGDIWALAPGAAWEIQRKQDPFVQKAIQLTVYDDQHPATDLIELGWPERWEPSVPGEGTGTVGGWLPAANGWTPDREQRTYKVNADGEELQWLRYRHFMPHSSTWPDPNQVNPDRVVPQAELISDFCSFNAFKQGFFDRDAFGVYWVGDLTLNATVQLDTVSDGGSITLELVEGPQIFQCEIDCQTGAVVLTVLDSNDRQLLTTIASGSTAVEGAGSYDITFANVDDRICLWVNGSLVEFDGPTEYESMDIPLPTSRDLAPVGIALANASGVVSDLLIQRDIYYRNDVITFKHEDGVSVSGDFHRNSAPVNSTLREEVANAGELSRHLNNPEAYAAIYAQQTAEQMSSFGEFGEYVLHDDEYLMFGDNSSMSKDSRLFDYETRPMNGVFSHRYAVREKDLIGKALFIFWPHGIPFLNDGKGISVWNHKGPPELEPKTYPYFRIPFYPNISRMQKIR